MKNNIVQSVYTDGSALSNPAGPGGWGVVIYFADNSIHELGGAEPSETTNNRMELWAAIEALKYLNDLSQETPVILYTDSEYVRNGITQWIKTWKQRRWRNVQGNPVLNRDLWEILDRLNLPWVEWQRVRGHSGNPGNDRADQIAKAFAAGSNPRLKQFRQLQGARLRLD